MNQAQIDAEINRVVAPLVRPKAQVNILAGGRCDVPEDAVRYESHGDPPLELFINQEANSDYSVRVTRIGSSTIIDELPVRPMPTEPIGLPERIFVEGDEFLIGYRLSLPAVALHYDLYTAICRELQVKTIMEIGVRAGYSAWAMLRGAPDATYTGIDADDGTCGGVVGYINHAEPMLRREYPEASVTVGKLDSQGLIALPGSYDLIHVDGHHGHDTALHDLRLCAPYADYLLIDDTSYATTVNSAVTEFLEENSFPAWRYDSWRGLILIDTRSLKGRSAASYFPDLFECSSFEEAKNAILTPAYGMQTEERWETETPWLERRLIFPEGLIFDIGCGIGRLSKPLCQRRNQTVIGIDASLPMRAMAVGYVGAGDRFAAISPKMFERMVDAGLRGVGALAIWALQHFHENDLIATVDLLHRALEPGAPLFTLDINARLIPVLMGGRVGWYDDCLSMPDVLTKAGFMLHETEHPEFAECAEKDAILRRWIRRR